MPNHGSSDICELCGTAGVKVRLVTRSFGQGSDLLVIEHVPLISCPHCGESYFTADTLHEIERIKRDRANVAVQRPVPVAEFSPA